MATNPIHSAIARDMVPVTPSDVTNVRYYGLKVKGTAGNVSVITDKGQTRTIPFTLGEFEPIAVTKVLSTGTTAVGIWGYVLF